MDKIINVFRYISTFSVFIPITFTLIFLVIIWESSHKNKYIDFGKLDKYLYLIILFIPFWLCGLIITSNSIKTIENPLEAENYSAYYYVLLSNDGNHYNRQIAEIERYDNDYIKYVEHYSNYFLSGVTINGERYDFDGPEYNNNIVIGKEMMISNSFYCILTNDKYGDNNKIKPLIPILSILSVLYLILIFTTDRCVDNTITIFNAIRSIIKKVIFDKSLFFQFLCSILIVSFMILIIYLFKDHIH